MTHDEVIRGNDARQLLENPLYKESFKTVRENLVGMLSRSALGDAETHHRIAIAVQVLDQLEKSLLDVVKTGQMAEIQLQDKKKFSIFG